MMFDPNRTFERSKELDHLHRNRARHTGRSGPTLALSLRFLRAAAARLATPTRWRVPERVPRPAPGGLAVTFVGHATVLLSSARMRVLTDPLLTNFFFGLRRVEAACLHPDDQAKVGLVLISHAHHDHLHRPSLRRLPRTATIVVPSRCAALVEDLGFARVVVLEPGMNFALEDVVVTAVAARHDGSRGFGDLGWRAAGGYVVRTSAATAYFAGDTGYFSGFEEIGRQHHPDIALLPIVGYEPLALRETHMSPLDALYGFEDLGARLLIPIAHSSFPLGYEPVDEPPRWLMELATARGIEDRIAVLRHGGTRVIAAP
jgi:L-ascorbate metabolism protein UlaG (beta-lactamase superfamily)